MGMIETQPVELSKCPILGLAYPLAWPASVAGPTTATPTVLAPGTCSPVPEPWVVRAGLQPCSWAPVHAWAAGALLTLCFSFCRPAADADSRPCCRPCPCWLPLWICYCTCLHPASCVRLQRVVCTQWQHASMGLLTSRSVSLQKHRGPDGKQGHLDVIYFC